MDWSHMSFHLSVYVILTVTNTYTGMSCDLNAMTFNLGHCSLVGRWFMVSKKCSTTAIYGLFTIFVHFYNIFHLKTC